MPKSNLVQKELMGFKNKEILAATENALENLPSHKILFNNGKVEEAHAWLNDPSPCYSKYVMNSFNFIEALNLKLLFPASPPKGSFCNCRNKLVNDPFHFLNCFNTNGVRKARLKNYIIANRKLSLDSGSNLVFLNTVKFSNNLRELVNDFSSNNNNNNSSTGSSSSSSSSWFIDF